MEKPIVDAMLKALNQQPCCKAIKTHGSPFLERGTPDILGCRSGRMFAIEAKQPGGSIEPLQRVRVEQWRRSGAYAGIADNVPDALAISRGDHERQGVAC